MGRPNHTHLPNYINGNYTFVKMEERQKMRERLIKLIESARYWGANTPTEIADILISNGVTVGGISVGQIIYRYDFDDMVHPIKEYVCTEIEDDGYFIVQNKNNLLDTRRLNYSSLQSDCFYLLKEYAEGMVKLNIRNTAKYVVENGKKLSVYSIRREGFLISVVNILCEDRLYFVVFFKDEHGNEKIHSCSQVRIEWEE